MGKRATSKKIVQAVIQVRSATTVDKKATSLKIAQRLIVEMTTSLRVPASSVEGRATLHATVVLNAIAVAKLGILLEIVNKKTQSATSVIKPVTLPVNVLLKVRPVTAVESLAT